MADDNVLDQNEIERLLGGMGGATPPAPEPKAEEPPADSGGVLGQSDLDALFGGGAAAAPAPADNGPLNQSDLDALFGGGAAPAAVPQPAVPTPAPTDNGPMNQSDLDALFGGGAAAPTPAPTPAPSLPPTSASLPPQPATPPSFAAAPPAFGGMGGFGGGGMAMGGDMDGEEDEDGVPRGDLDYILKRADASVQSIASNKLDLPTEVIEFQFPEFGGTVPSSDHATLDQISEVELDVKIELGRANMYLEDVLKLRKGSVVPLDKMAGDAVDVYVNGRLLARGEVLVMNENFCVRVAELLAGAIPME